MKKYRFKTREEFIRDGLWNGKYNCPDEWAWEGQMNKYLGMDIPNEAYIKAIEKAESLETHKELKKINNLAFSLMYYIENINELKNIRTKENFKLRAEIAELKSKL